MWFDDKEIILRNLGKNRKRQPSKTILGVNTRASSVLNAESYKLGVFVLIPVLMVIVGIVVWLVWTSIFAKNVKFIINKVDIESGKLISKDLIKEWTGITEGKNMFDFNIGEAREKVLRECKTIKLFEISRKFPDTVKMTVVERTPVAIVAEGSRLVADREGIVFPVKSGFAEMPLIRGISNQRLKPGSKVEGNALLALELFETSRYNFKDQLDIVAIDVSNKEYLVLYLGDRKVVKLAWKKMSEQTEESHETLLSKLGELAKYLQNDTKAVCSVLDYTFDDRIIGDTQAIPK